MQRNQDAIPAGSGVPEPTGQTELDLEQDAPTPDTTEVEEPASETPAAPDEMGSLKSQLANAEKLIGRQGKELGELRKEYKTLSASAQKVADQSSDPDFDTRLGDIQRQVDSGDIDFGQALRLTAQLSAEMGASRATNDIQGRMQQDEQRKVQQGFLDANPDFTELVETGGLEEIKAGNPLHDDVSAYYEYRAKMTETKMAEAIEAARKEGEQKGARERQQADKAENVIGKQGSNVRDKASRTSFKNDTERKEAMVEALRTARQAS